MPEMDGFQTTEKIRDIERAENAPAIIAVTADAMKGVAQKCMKLGMDDYISKPVDISQLKEKLLEWIPNNQTRDSQNKDVEIFGSHFQELTEGDEDLQKELMKIFIENLQIDLKALHQHFQERNFQAWEEIAHKLYGASSHVGASALAKVCLEAERIDLSDKMSVKSTHLAILKESKSVKSAIVNR